MTLSSPPALRAWIVVPFAAIGFLFWSDAVRLEHVQYVTGLAHETPKIDPASPTGYAEGVRELIVPTHNNDTYEWIAQTQQMFARGEWRVRHIDYENAPLGRQVDAPSPYRWWLGGLAWIDHLISGRPLGSAVEHAALYADPLLHGLLVIGASMFVAWQMEGMAAALLALGLVAVFPFGSGFIPGAPDDHGLIMAVVLCSVLPLLAGFNCLAIASTAGDRDASILVRSRVKRWFVLGGVLGGVGCWLSISSELPVLGGMCIGALLAAWVVRSGGESSHADARDVPPWRAWAVSGAITNLVAYVLEFAPGHLWSWDLRVGHPLYSLVWLGAGEVLTRLAPWIQRAGRTWRRRDTVMVALGLAAVALLPLVMWRMKQPGFNAAELTSGRLSKLADGMAAGSLWSWMVRDGFTSRVNLTLLPALLVVPAVALLFWRRGAPMLRAAVALALGPVIVALGYAGSRLSWWNLADGTLLALLVAASALVANAGIRRAMSWAWAGAMASILLPGLLLLVPPRSITARHSLNESEVFGLIERDLARWIESHADANQAVILAPNNVTSTLVYYGGMRGLGTLSWGNRDGLQAAIRIASASTPEEARELIDKRGITHIVAPSWDPYLDVYARMGMGQLEGTFLARLHNWNLPPWLRPMPYRLPTIPGFKRESITVLEVVENQQDAAALSWIAEYFIELGDREKAAAVGQSLRRFPADIGAWIARAEVAVAIGDDDGLAGAMKILLPRLKAKRDRGILWERRVGLAAVLAHEKEMDLAKAQVTHCLASIDAAKVRALPSGMLYRLLYLAKAFGTGITDPKLQQLALDLVPPDLRSRL